jgi:hypothetical protein
MKRLHQKNIKWKAFILNKRRLKYGDLNKTKLKKHIF